MENDIWNEFPPSLSHSKYFSCSWGKIALQGEARNFALDEIDDCWAIVTDGPLHPGKYEGGS